MNFPKTPTTPIEKELTIPHGFGRDQFSTETQFTPLEIIETKVEINKPVNILYTLIPLGILIYLVIRK